MSPVALHAIGALVMAGLMLNPLSSTITRQLQAEWFQNVESMLTTIWPVFSTGLPLLDLDNLLPCVPAQPPVDDAIDAEGPLVAQWQGSLLRWPEHPLPMNSSNQDLIAQLFPALSRALRPSSPGTGLAYSDFSPSKVELNPVTGSL